jgi:hypothetical protein
MFPHMGIGLGLSTCFGAFADHFAVMSLTPFKGRHIMTDDISLKVTANV